MNHFATGSQGKVKPSIFTFVLLVVLFNTLAVLHKHGFISIICSLRVNALTWHYSCWSKTWLRSRLRISETLCQPLGFGPLHRDSRSFYDCRAVLLAQLRLLCVGACDRIEISSSLIGCGGSGCLGCCNEPPPPSPLHDFVCFRHRPACVDDSFLPVTPCFVLQLCKSPQGGRTPRFPF